MKGKKKSKHQKAEEDGMVYSTNPQATFADLFANLVPVEKEPQIQGTVYVSLNRKNRAGKPVTLIEGVNLDRIEELGKSLKTKCGAGGAVKEGQILIQGDFRMVVTSALRDLGMHVKQKGG